MLQKLALKHKIKVIGGIVVLIWLITPLSEISIIASFIATSQIPSLPLIYVIPISIVLGLIIGKLVDYFDLKDYMEREIGKIKSDLSET